MFGAIVLSYLVVNPFYPKETNLIVGLCVGAGVGVGQIIAARPWFRLARSWMWGAAVVMGPPFIALVVLRELGWELDTAPAQASLTTVALAGGLAGSWIQARALRGYSSQPLWWVAASLLSWSSAYALSVPAGTVGSALVLGLVSGGLFLWVLAR